MTQTTQSALRFGTGIRMTRHGKDSKKRGHRKTILETRKCVVSGSGGFGELRRDTGMETEPDHDRLGGKCVQRTAPAVYLDPAGAVFLRNHPGYAGICSECPLSEANDGVGLVRHGFRAHRGQVSRHGSDTCKGLKGTLSDHCGMTAEHRMPGADILEAGLTHDVPGRSGCRAGVRRTAGCKRTVAPGKRRPAGLCARAINTSPWGAAWADSAFPCGKAIAGLGADFMFIRLMRPPYGCFSTQEY
jgi:hypothetical protein